MALGLKLPVGQGKGDKMDHPFVLTYWREKLPYIQFPFNTKHKICKSQQNKFSKSGLQSPLSFAYYFSGDLLTLLAETEPLNLLKETSPSHLA